MFQEILLFMISRREWLVSSAAVLASAGCKTPQPSGIRVRVWDERQPAQKKAYPNWLGNQIADHLRTVSGLSVESVCIDDPEQGLKDLDSVDVLVWWGHVRHAEIEPATAARIVERIRIGKLSLLALHSAHWSRPFVGAMNAVALDRALAALPENERSRAVVVESDLLPRPWMAPSYKERLSPEVQYRRPSQGPVEVRLLRANCCFPAYRGDGKPSEVRIRLPRHPIAQGVPESFAIEQTEMYDEPFHVPAPDEVVLEEHWSSGEWFRSGSVWRLGSGRVFYFRPGHETYPVFFNPNALRIVANAARWLGQR
jgi:trehalose utilization protein